MKRGKESLARVATLGLVIGMLSLLPWAGRAAEAPPEKQAEEKEVLRLEEAVAIALENHPRIMASRERVGAQRAVLGQEFAAYYPTVTLNNFYRTGLASGTTTVSERGFDFFSSQASFDMTLYNFGKREASVQSARDTLESTRQALRTTTDEIILRVKEAYYAYLAAQALVRVREDTVKDRELLVRQAQGFYEVGTRPRIDVARAESNLYNARADLIAAQNGVKIAWATLKNAMGVRDFPERPLAPDISITRFPLSLVEAKEEALSFRPELKDFAAQRKAQDEKIANARRGHLPDILFSADYGRRNTSRGGDTFPLQLNWQVQVSLIIPIFEGFRTTYRVEEAVRNYQNVRAQEENERQQVELEVEQSYLRLIESEERIKANEAAVRAARENLDLANGRYQVGVGSIIEVTEAQTLHTDAQTNRIRSYFDYKVAEAQLSKAIGKP